MKTFILVLAIMCAFMIGCTPTETPEENNYYDNLSWIPEEINTSGNITVLTTCLNGTFWCSNTTIREGVLYCGIDDFTECYCNNSGCINITE